MNHIIHRLLKEGDTFQKGDEMQNPNTGYFEPIPKQWIGLTVTYKDKDTTFARMNIVTRRKVKEIPIRAGRLNPTDKTQKLSKQKGKRRHVSKNTITKNDLSQQKSEELYNRQMKHYQKTLEKQRKEKEKEIEKKRKEK